MSAEQTMRPLPRFQSDEEAERFIEEADLTEYDLSAMQPMRFEIAKKTARVNLRMPEGMVDALKKLAEKRGVPYQRLIREGVERILHEAKP